MDSLPRLLQPLQNGVGDGGEPVLEAAVEEGVVDALAVGDGEHGEAVDADAVEALGHLGADLVPLLAALDEI